MISKDRYYKYKGIDYVFLKEIKKCHGKYLTDTLEDKIIIINKIKMISAWEYTKWCYNWRAYYKIQDNKICYYTAIPKKNKVKN